jgi:predicted nucleic acid-binding protein
MDSSSRPPLMEKLLSSKFDSYVSREQRDALLLRLAPLIENVTVVQVVQASRDPKDDKFLDVAVNGLQVLGGDYIFQYRYDGTYVVILRVFHAREDR